MLSIANQNKLRDMEERIARLEAQIVTLLERPEDAIVETRRGRPPKSKQLEANGSHD
jgi:hypothetical protein